MDSTFFAAPWLFAFAAAILVLHVLTHFLPKRQLPLTIVNVLVHVGFCAALILAGGTLYEFILVLLVSSFTSLLLGRLEEPKQ